MTDVQRKIVEGERIDLAGTLKNTDFVRCHFYFNGREDLHMTDCKMIACKFTFTDEAAATLKLIRIMVNEAGYPIANVLHTEVPIQ